MTTDGHRDLLVELCTEELPPSSFDTLVAAFPDEIATGLETAGLDHGSVKGFGSPRHLAVLVRDVAVRQPDRAIERRGPALRAAFDADGNPTKAAEGFARSVGVAVSELVRIETDKGEWLAYRGTEAGRDTAELLPDIVNVAIARLPLPRRMRWGAGEEAFIRPVHRAVLMLGEAVVPARILGVETGRETVGHRFHHPGAIDLTEPAAYRETLREPGRVIVDVAERREAIREQVLATAAEIDGEAVIDDALLDEVTALVEWPVALAGSFDPDFLRVPAEALISSMQGHQKYFPVRDADGRLIPRFITVANLESRDAAQVIAGNERVIRPRLADAAFFWDQDRRHPLSERLEALKGVVFQKRLGTLYDKTARVAALAGALAAETGVPADQAERAGWLCKADLVTEMVGEFPELQGIMGRYYAREDGEPDAVADALDEVYWPRFAGDRIPAGAVGRIVGIADRLDTLVGIFGIGRAPTGAKDPFALRRAALGLLRIAIEARIDLDLHAWLDSTVAGFSERGWPLAEDTAATVFAFLMDRLRPYYADQGVSVDSLEAVLARSPRSLLDLDQRVRAVEAFRELPEAEALAAANKRISNILRQAGASVPTETDPLIRREAAEEDLFRAVQSAEERVTPLFGERDYRRALGALAELREPVDRFFDDVMVMADDPDVRGNRLALLQRLSSLFLGVADISRLQG